ELVFQDLDPKLVGYHGLFLLVLRYEPISSGMNRVHLRIALKTALIVGVLYGARVQGADVAEIILPHASVFLKPGLSWRDCQEKPESQDCKDRLFYREGERLEINGPPDKQGYYPVKIAGRSEGKNLAWVHKSYIE